MVVLLALLLLLLTSLLSSVLNAFGADFLYNLVVFNTEITNTAILLKL